MIVVYGAGAVGLTLGATLARNGAEVLFVARRPEVAKRIEAQGVRVEDPASGEVFTCGARAVAGVEAAAERIEAGPVLFCMRGSDVDSAADALVRVAPRVPVVSLQNDVDNEERLARRFERVIGAAVRQTSTRTAENAVVTLRPGRYVVGAWTEAASGDAAQLAETLRAAGYDVGLSERIAEDKWLKLCVNLMSAPNALIRRADHTTRAFVEGKARLVEEARDALAAADIVARSCDGRDRSLDEEIAWQRASLARGQSARALPVYNQVWAALRGGGPLEADGYHRRIVGLAAAHGLGAAANERVLAALLRAFETSSGPECLGAAELFGAR